MKESHRALDMVHGGHGSPQDAAWRDYLTALRAEKIEDMVAAEDGDRDPVAHQIQFIDEVLSDTVPHRAE